MAGLRGEGWVGLVADQAALSFGGLLRQLRAEARLTQEELAEAAQLSPRAVSDLERGINRTARKDTAELLADALSLAEPVRGLFVAAARGRGPAEDVLAARDGRTPARVTGPPHVGCAGARTGGCCLSASPMRTCSTGGSGWPLSWRRKLLPGLSRGGLVVVTGASGSGKSSLLRAGLLPILARGQQVPGSDRWPRIVMTPTKDPLTELAARLAAVGGPDALAVRDGLARHPDQAHLAIRSAVLAAVPPRLGAAGVRRRRCAAGAVRRPVRAGLHPEPGPGRGGYAAGVHHGVVLGRRQPGRSGAGTTRAGGDRGARGLLGPVRRRSPSW